MKKRRDEPDRTPGSSVKGDAVSANWKVENVVATVTIDTPEKIDLNSVARKFTNCTYNPERFPGLIMRVEHPRSTALVFSTGKMVVTGLKHEEDASGATAHVIDKLKECKVKINGEPVIQLQNIVASGSIGNSIRLDDASITLDGAIYEPEVFPGLILRMASPKSVFLLFGTGKFVCTGVRHVSGIKEAVDAMISMLSSKGLVSHPGDRSFDDTEAIDDYDGNVA